MRASVLKSALIASLSLCGAPALAGTNGLYLPTAPQGSGGEDSIETASGIRCRQSMNSNGAYVDFGVTGTTNQQRGGGGNNVASLLYADQSPREATAYARVTIPLGRKPERIDCNQIYQLEVTRLKREIELLKLGVK